MKKIVNGILCFDNEKKDQLVLKTKDEKVQVFPIRLSIDEILPLVGHSVIAKGALKKNKNSLVVSKLSAAYESEFDSYDDDVQEMSDLLGEIAYSGHVSIDQMNYAS